MKHLFFILIALLAVSVMAFGQKQPLPTMPGGVQGTRSAMLKGPHDFTPDSGNYVLSIDLTDPLNPDTSWHPHGPARGLCSYCHAPHVPVTGIARPLWIRASVTDRTFGDPYSNPSSLDATVENIEASDNYSSFCMSCHDGSAIFTAAAYTEGNRPYGGSAASWVPAEAYTVSHEANIKDGEFNLEHVHPVNFDYNAAQALDPQGIYEPVSATAVWTGDNGSGMQTSVRLFDGYMQCSSCHNPHLNSGIGLAYSSSYGKLCVSCHKK